MDAFKVSSIAVGKRRFSNSPKTEQKSQKALYLRGLLQSTVITHNNLSMNRTSSNKDNQYGW
jgi:hypothetical protein